MCGDYFHFIHRLGGGAEAAGAFRVRASAPSHVGSLMWILSKCDGSDQQQVRGEPETHVHRDHASVFTSSGDEESYLN